MEGKTILEEVRKDKDGNYTNCTWNAILVGKAQQENVSQNDTINILSGQIFQDKGKDGKYYTNVTIFDLEFANKEQKKKDDMETFDPEGFRALEDGDELIPF